ncbi:hypothetical protein [Microcoleus sp. MON2_D5]
MQSTAVAVRGVGVFALSDFECRSTDRISRSIKVRSPKLFLN